MSFSHLLKDFVDALNDFYGSFYGSSDFLEIFKFTFFYLLNSCRFLIQYILTFRWFSDFCFLKISVPRLIYSSFMDNPIFDNPSLYLFNFFDTPNFINHPFFSGLANSCLFSLPVSANQILLLRRVTVEGVYAGTAAGMGLVVGQSLFIICIICGLRFIIFPWLAAEFLHYLLGLILTLSAVYVIANKPIRRIKASETETLKRIFILHVCLTWTEQTTFFPYLSNISFNPEPTIFEMLNSNDSVEALFDHWTYSCGLMAGSIILTLFFGWLIYWMGYALSTRLNFTYSRWVRTIHNGSLVTLIAFSLSSFSYYSFDYVTSAPFGFIAEDDGLRNYHIRTTSRDFKKGRLGEYSSHTSLDTDASPFDRGRYLTSSEVELTYEDLNYQGEYIWRSRNDRLSSGSPGLVNKLIKKFLPRFKRSRISLIENAKFLKKEKEKKEQLAQYRAQKKAAEKAERKAQRLALQEYNEDEYYDDEDYDDLNLDIYLPLYNYICEREDLIQRFIDDYQIDTQQSVAPDFYHDIGQEPYSAFSELAKYGFDSFASLEDVESDEFEETLGKRMKSKYYSNWVYKYLLRIDFAEFLSRQPKKYFLKDDEENLLFDRRLLLANYYDSLRGYFQTPYSDNYEELFIGSKSYANKVYNQQFIGTLKIIRQLFAINLEDADNIKEEVVLKYDQPLFKEELDEQNPLIHEEINEDEDFEDEDFEDEDFEDDENVFLEEGTSTPFYAGWDMKSRKFLITNYLLTRSNLKRTTKNIYKMESRMPKRSKSIYFISWPLNKYRIEDIKNSENYHLNLSYSAYNDPSNELQKDIFEYSEIEESDIRLIYETLPSILKRVDLRDKDKSVIVLQPLKGGLAWPGNEPLRLEIRERLLEFVPKMKGLKLLKFKLWG